MKAFLACSTIPTPDQIVLPKYSSIKLDGIRCLIINEIGRAKAVSRTLKSIPNDYIRNELSKSEFRFFDGEISLPDSNNFDDVVSAVMTKHGRPDFIFNVFDEFSNPNLPFRLRLGLLERRIREISDPRIQLLEQLKVTTHDQVQALYDEAIDAGHEGLILKDPNTPYKFGRSTLKQNWMLKLKPVNDAEGVVFDVEELMHNSDTSTKHQANLSGGNCLGALVIKFNDRIFKVGSGFTQAQREALWQQDLVGKKVTFKYQNLTKDGIPRFPVFKAFREGY